jgi:methyl-accepting chemotaxis protein
MKGVGVLKRLTVVRAISLGYILIIALFVASVVISTLSINNIKSTADKNRTDREAMIVRINDLSSAVNKQINALRAELLARSMGGGTLEDIGVAQQETKKTIDTLKKADLGPKGKAALAEIDSLITTYNRTSAKVLALAREGQVQEATDLAEREASPMATLLDRALEAFSKEEMANLKTQLDDSNATTDRWIAVGYTFVGVSLAVAILLAIFIPRSISRQLRQMVSRLGISTAEMLAVTSQVAAGAVQTATAISEAATTVDEVRQTSLLASQKATAVSDSAQQADEVAEGGRRAVSETLEGIRRIQEQMQVVADSVVRLSEQTEAVSEIIATSNDIAEQSNLLSVNAAIEAAKASEQGKGFSVVAEEIKNLAQQSKQGVMQVRSILNDIQRATSAAVMAAEQSGKAIEDGAAQALESSQAIESLAENVAAAAQSAMQIVASAQQQLVGMDQISEAMASIDQASAQNASGARQMESEVQHLQELARNLQAMIDAKWRSKETDVLAQDAYDAVEE